MVPRHRDIVPVVFTLRCTQKLLNRIQMQMVASGPAMTIALGDWYAKPGVVCREHRVPRFAERTCLPVLVPACDLAALAPRPREALLMLLETIGVSTHAACVEQGAVEEIPIAKRAGVEHVRLPRA